MYIGPVVLEIILEIRLELYENNLKFSCKHGKILASEYSIVLNDRQAWSCYFEYEAALNETALWVYELFMATIAIIIILTTKLSSGTVSA